MYKWSTEHAVRVLASKEFDKGVIRCAPNSNSPPLEANQGEQAIWRKGYHPDNFELLKHLLPLRIDPVRSYVVSTPETARF